MRTKPDEARQFMKGYTAIEGPLTGEVPLAAYMLYNEFKPSDVAYFQKFFDLFSEKGIFDKKVVVDPTALQGLSHGRRRRVATAACPGPRRAAGAGRAAARKPIAWATLPAVPRPARAVHHLGPGGARCGFIKPILLPTPLDDARRRWSPAWPAGRCCGDFAVTVWRTLQAFLIAAVVGVPLGVLLGSNEKAYRSVEFLIDFFRSTPSSALIPLFLLIFGVSDINKVAIAAFGALLIVVFNSAYGVINARKQRVMAAQGDGRVALADLQGRADLGEPAADASSACARRCRWRW